MVPALALVTACERVVAINPPAAPERLAVSGRLEARLDAPSGRQEITLSITAPYFRNAALPPARDAVVRVRDERGVSVFLREDELRPGTYVTDSLVARAGGVYTVQVEWRGDRYQMIDSLPARIVAIDTMYFAPRPGRTAAADGVRATIALTDPPGPNYYAWDQIVDGVRWITPDTTALSRVIISDEFIDGVRANNVQPYEFRAVRTGQQVTVQQLSLSRGAYRFLSALNEQITGDGSPFSVPPSNLRGNVANLTRPDAFGVGYLMAVGVASQTARVP